MVLPTTKEDIMGRTISIAVKTTDTDSVMDTARNYSVSAEIVPNDHSNTDTVIWTGAEEDIVTLAENEYSIPAYELYEYEV
jgi:hypothetical protein